MNASPTLAPITPGPLPYDHKSLVPGEKSSYSAAAAAADRISGECLSIYAFRDNLPRSLADERFFCSGVG